MDGGKSAENLLQQQYQQLRPQLPEIRKEAHEPPPSVKCPRCDSSNTKFCYYNNYSLSQPRYFCKDCRRYWNHGGTLRNVAAGGDRSETLSSPPDLRLQSLSGTISGQLLQAMMLGMRPEVAEISDLPPQRVMEEHDIVSLQPTDEEVNAFYQRRFGVNLADICKYDSLNHQGKPETDTFLRNLRHNSSSGETNTNGHLPYMPQVHMDISNENDQIVGAKGNNCHYKKNAD